MTRILLALAALGLGACATEPPAPTSAARGQALVEANCSACHAVGQGDSPAPEAPPFRLLSQNYRVDTLAEALAEGISVGHPAMPEFQFETDEVDAIIVYLQSIQVQAAPD